MRLLGRIASILVFLLIASAAIHQKNWPSGLGGTWVRATTDDREPELLTLRQRKDQVIMKYFLDGGVETITTVCDGLEHPQSLFTTETYRAQFKDDSVVIKSRVDLGGFATAYPELDKFKPGLVSSQEWVLSADGKELTIRKRGEFTTYRRPTLWEWLWAKIP